MFIMIDNYDSFVYNLVRYFEELGENIAVYRNNKIGIEDIRRINPEGIIISPGPKTPWEAGISIEIINEFKGVIPILGICLGHQALAYAFGGKVMQGKEPVHGKLSQVFHDHKGMFTGIKNPITVTRYHSLIVDEDTLPTCFEITCRTVDGIIMGIRHKKYILEGLQFHPEAELSECGHEMLKNFISIARRQQGD